VSSRLARLILAGFSTAFLLIYAFVLLVAFATSGHELVRQPGAWYAALAPLAYVGTAGAYAYGLVSRPMSTPAWVGLQVVLLPAVLFSFIGLGLMLPVVAACWWWMRRAPGSPA
jgi:DMSO/TMAO reductase YedYZ heme-binding membrane subunit